MSEIYDEPPDENEAFENLDEALDEEDARTGFRGGPEGQRDLDFDLTVDEEELREAGALLDDPDQFSMLSGGMDDPEGTGRLARRARREEGWGGTDDAGADGSADEDDLGGGPAGDPALEVTPVDATELDQVPDDAPGPDSARW